MSVASRSFQVFAKPVGAACNLGCRYCYALGKGHARRSDQDFRMSKELLQEYIRQHISASPDDVIRFSWHGGEPLLFGLDDFGLIVELQRRHLPAGRKIANGLQTNGTLLDDAWGRFLQGNQFSVGLSLDGPRAMHDHERLARDGSPSFEEALRGFKVLQRHGVVTDILCVVGAHNVQHPHDVYGFFKDMGASYVTFLPLVEADPGAPAGVTARSVSSEAWGDFLCAIFDQWLAEDIGKIKVQIIEEAARTAFGQEHSLCLFRPVCGDIPVIDRNGDFYPCDHYVAPEHCLGNILTTPLAELIESTPQRAFGSAKQNLPRMCQDCPVKVMCQGECPKNRFLKTPDGEPGLNYLCPGYLRFFTHVRPFVSAIADEWRRELRTKMRPLRFGDIRS
jgi:uncharacterized protein